MAVKLFNFSSMQVARVNSSGVPVGQLNPASLSNDTTSSAYRVKGVIESTLAVPEREQYTWYGDGSFKGSAIGGIRSIPPFTVSSISFDQTLNSLLVGGSVDSTTLSNVKISGLNVSNTQPNDVVILFSTSAQDYDLGTTKALNVFMYATATPNGFGLNGNSGANPIPTSYTIAPKLTTKLPTGIALGTNQGLTNNEDAMLFLESAYPFALTTYVQDGTETTFTTAYKPVYSTTGAVDNSYVQNGSVVTPTSFSTSTGVVTMAAAGTAAQLYVVMYQTQFVPT